MMYSSSYFAAYSLVYYATQGTDPVPSLGYFVFAVTPGQRYIIIGF